jgi:hypothetical protein
VIDPYFPIRYDLFPSIGRHGCTPVLSDTQSQGGRMYTILALACQGRVSARTPDSRARKQVRKSSIPTSGNVWVSDFAFVDAAP